LLASLIVISIAGEIGLLSPMLAPRFEDALARHGVDARIEHVRVGVVNGLRLHNVRIDHAVGDVMLPEVTLSLIWDRFWSRRHRNWLLHAADATVATAATPEHARLQLRRLQVQALLGDNQLRRLHSTAQLHGIELEISCEQPLALLAGRQSSAGRPNLAALPAKLIPALVEFFHRQQFHRRESSLHIHVVAAEHDQSFQLQFRLRLPRLRWQEQYFGVELDGQWQNSLLQVDWLQLRSRDGDLLSGHGSYNQGQLHAELQLHAAVGQLRQWLPELPLPPALAALPLDQLRSKAAFTVQGQLADRSSWRARGSVRIAALKAAGIDLTAARAEFKLDHQMLHIENLVLDLASAAKQQLRGQMQLDLPGGHGRLVVAGSVAPSTLFDAWGGAAPWLQQIAADLRWQRLPQFSLELEMPAVLHPASWRGTASITAEQLRLRNLPIARVQTQLELKDHGIDAVINAELDADEHLVANLQIIPRSKRAAVQVSATVLPDKLLTALNLPIPKPLEPLDFMRPLRLVLDLPLQTIDHQRWHGSFNATAVDVRVENLHLQHAQLSGSIEPAQIRIAVHELVSSADDRLQANLTLDRPFTTMTVAGQMRGDPRLLRYFVPGRGRRHFDQIWQRFRWSQEHKPTITLDHLQFSRWLDINGDSDLQLDASFAAEDISYEMLSADRLRARVEVRLPDQISINDIELHRDSDIARGKIDIHLGTDPKYYLEFAGTFDPWAAIGGFAGDLGDWPQRSEFASGTYLELQGGGKIDNNSTLGLTGKLQTPQLRFDKLQIDNLACRWRWDNNTLTWSDLNAQIYDGSIKTEGRFDLRRQLGDMQINASGVRLQALLGAFASEYSEADQSRLQLDCAVAISRPGTPRRLHLDGRGSLQISEADLWKLPFFHRLADVLRFSLFERISNLGSITTLNAEMIFAGDRVEVPSLTTDGTLLSLRGKGMYGLSGHRLAFAIEGVALRNLPFIPRTVSPLAWLFGAELHGTVSNPNWKLASGVRRILTGKDDSLSFDQSKSQ